jgi:aldose 1-epimerase
LADPEIVLTEGDLALRLAPALGGAIAAWRRGDMDLLRPARRGADGLTTVRELASYPLIPFSNRIGRGRFSFAGEPFVLPLDRRDPRHALHGNALYAAWDVLETAAAAMARLRLRYVPGMPDVPYFPFAYEAEQIYTLTAASLRIGLRLRNADARAFPAGFGHHLYFPRRTGARLRFNAEGYWTNGPDGLPVAPAYDLRTAFAAGESVDACALDHCFFGWDGVAEILYPQNGYALCVNTSAELRNAVVFTPRGQDFFAFEPVSHTNDAVNRRAEGERGAMRILAPGQEMTASICIGLTTLK